MARVNAGSASQAHFARLPQTNIRRSKFHRPSTYKTTMDSGYLIPFYIDEVLPGDTFEFTSSIFARLSTPIVPFMDDIWLDTQFFFVPNRLIWEHWEEFNGAQKNPGDSTDYLVPVVTTPEGGWQTGSLSDYFGLPLRKDIEDVDSLWHRAYNLIWNEWYRDENLQDSVPVPVGDGPDDPEDFVLLKRGKRKDYFTSSLPWPQKGPGVELPLGSIAPVMGNGMSLGLTGYNDLNGGLVANSSTGVLYSQGAAYGQPYGASQESSVYVAGNIGVTQDSENSGLIADLSSATAATINSFRMAFQLQTLFEIDARGGTRYFEILEAHFATRSPDSRLQRPEYLGGSSIKLDMLPVAQQSSTNEVSPQGNLAGYGIFGGAQPKWMKSFVEHGVIIGLVSVRTNLTYQNGIHRMFSRQTRWDFYWPALAHLGEQAVLNKEIFADGSEADNEVFGYQERWAEYRYGSSLITGKLRSDDPQSLDYWHLSQNFENLPTLSADFIEENPPLGRVLAVQDEPQIIFDSYRDVYCTRPMPTYSIPGLVTHF